MVSFLNLIFIQFICITIFILKTRNTDSQVTYWIAMSDYDLKTAKMLLTGRYLLCRFHVPSNNRENSQSILD